MDGVPALNRPAGRRLACHHHDAHRCRSCTLLTTAYGDQLASKQAQARDRVPGADWLPPVTSPVGGFRNKAKMVVAGTVDAPTLGILGPDGGGVDLRDCPLYEPGLLAAMPALARFVTTARLTPYDVPARRGELKHVIATVSPDAELMVRLVLRSTEALARVRKHLPGLRAELDGAGGVPALRVASVNVQPEHKAVLEGEREIVLTGHQELPMRLVGPGGTRGPGGVVLHLRPRSFFQTNTAVATALYHQAAAWAAGIAPASVLDLYCGVGGFALHLGRALGPGAVTGVELSGEAVESARTAAEEAGVEGTFHATDAAAYALGLAEAPDLVVLNPPRRGTGPELAGWLERSGVQHVLYSSCHTGSLARDLAAMPSLRPVRARLFDMFPNTAHHEVLVHLARR